MTLRRQYHFRPTPDGTLIWDVRRLVDLACDLDTVNVPLSNIRELDEPYWFGAASGAPTCRAIATHMEMVRASDPGFPILLCAEGRVMDGMHRVVKALIEGHETILSKRFPTTPRHDFCNVAPEDLLYD